MTATTIRIVESEPSAWPAVEGLSAAAAPFLFAAWARVESYIAWRGLQRSVVFTVEGAGHWTPPLRPVSVELIETWDGSCWQETTLQPSPYGGLLLPDCGPYRMTGVAGDDAAAAPDLVAEAVRRLAEYMAAIGFGDVGKRTETVPDIWSGEYASPSWRARALQDSGAADLLRQFRRA